jgi:predicted RNA polymerase sigma factor
MLLTDARRPARTGPHDELIPLSKQDRQLWDHKLIAEGQELLSQALPQRAIGYYQIQAAITAVHDEAETAEQTDWPQILALYGLLQHMTANPMVGLNRAIAVAMVHGPAAGLALLNSLDTALTGHYRLNAVRAHLLELAGDTAAAIDNYRQAASRTTSLAERHYLTEKAAALAAHRQTMGERDSDRNEALSDGPFAARLPAGGG